MKKIVYILIFCCCFSVIGKAQFANPRLTEYTKYLRQLPYDTLSSLSKATVKYGELFKGQNPKECDSAFLIFEEFQMKVIAETDFLVDLLIASSQTNNKLHQKGKNYQKLLDVNGLTFLDEDDQIIIIPKKEFVEKNFFPHLTPSMQKYLLLVDGERRKGFVKNSAVVIPATLLENRLIAWENFIVRNPDFLLLSEVKERHETYLEAYIFGMPGSPLFTGEGNTLRTSYRQSYHHMVETYTNTQTANIISYYIQNLQACDYRQCLKVQMFSWNPISEKRER